MTMAYAERESLEASKARHGGRRVPDRTAIALLGALGFGLGSGSSAPYLIAIMATLVSVVTTFLTLSFKKLF
jgi:hypothetical protein